jgi:hypothetical protein
VPLSKATIYLIKEAELYSTSRFCGPDRKVGAAISNLTAENVGIGWLHFAIQALSLSLLMPPQSD